MRRVILHNLLYVQTRIIPSIIHCITSTIIIYSIAESCTTVVRNAEKVVECLHYRTLQYTNARNDSDVIMG